MPRSRSRRQTEIERQNELQSRAAPVQSGVPSGAELLQDPTPGFTATDAFGVVDALVRDSTGRSTAKILREKIAQRRVKRGQTKIPGQRP